MKKTVRTYDTLSELTAALAHLIHAGISPADALNALAGDEQDPALRETLEEMTRQADSGVSLAQCAAQAGCFPDYFCTLLQIGQTVGRTEQTLSALSAYYEGRARLRRHLRSALIYPAVLLAVLLAVLVVLLVWVLPVFDDVYAQLGSGLTGVAGGLLAAGNAVRAALPWIGGLLALAALIMLISPVRRGCMALARRHFGDRGVFARVNNARFLQALSLGITSGMTAEEAARMAAAMATGEIPGFLKRCEKCLSGLEAGTSLSRALADAAILPPSQCRLLEAGNRSGRMEAVLEQIALDRLADSEEALSRSAQKLEPAVVLFACLMIGLILLSVMLPLANIMNAIG